MSERSWVKLHSGLTGDPQHRERMGIRVWWFIEAVNRADWETGVIYGYSDPWFAKILDMPESTVRKHRTGLQDEKYIVCHPAFQGLHIRIMRWRNPRLVNPQMVNIPDRPETWCPLLDTHPASKVDTLSIVDQSLTTPAKQLLERHFAFTLGAIALEPWNLLVETYGTEEFEQALIDTVNQGGGRRMNLNYVKAILERKARERDGDAGDIDSLLAAMEADINGR